MKRIYLDNAASTPMDPELLSVMEPYLTHAFGNPSSTHAHGRELRAALEQARRTVAACLGARPSEIFFTSGGTEADNTSLLGAVLGYGIRHIISSRIEHHAVTHTLEALQKYHGIELTWLTPDQLGRIDPDQLREALKAQPKSLVSLMHANNELGTLNDLYALGQICLEYEAWFHSDTVQGMGHVPYDMASLPVHFAAASAHKFYGPKGVGFLYIQKGVEIPALILGGGQERNMRAGTENIAFIVGMAHTLDKCYKELEAKNRHLLSLKHSLKAGLSAMIPDMSFNGDLSETGSIPTVLNAAFPGESDQMLTFHLDIAGISTSGGSACNSGASIGSHVLTGIGCTPVRAQNSVRFSFGWQNTLEDIQLTLDALGKILQVAV